MCEAKIEAVKMAMGKMPDWITAVLLDRGNGPEALSLKEATDLAIRGVDYEIDDVIRTEDMPVTDDGRGWAEMTVDEREDVALRWVRGF